MPHHRMRHLVDIGTGLYGLACHLRHRIGQERGVGFGADRLHIQIPHDVGMPGQQLAYRLRPLHQEAAGTFSPFALRKFGDASDAFRLGIRDDFGFNRHTR